MDPPAISVDLKGDVSTSGYSPREEKEEASLMSCSVWMMARLCFTQLCKKREKFSRKHSNFPQATFSSVHIYNSSRHSNFIWRKFFVLCNPVSCPGHLPSCFYSCFSCPVLGSRTVCLLEGSFHLRASCILSQGEVVQHPHFCTSHATVFRVCSGSLFMCCLSVSFGKSSWACGHPAGLHPGCCRGCLAEAMWSFTATWPSAQKTYLACSQQSGYLEAQKISMWSDFYSTLFMRTLMAVLSFWFSSMSPFRNSITKVKRLFIPSLSISSKASWASFFSWKTELQDDTITSLNDLFLPSFLIFFLPLVDKLDWLKAGYKELINVPRHGFYFVPLSQDLLNFFFFALLLVSVSPLLMWQIRELMVEVTLWHVSSLSEEISRVWNSGFISNWILSFSLKRLCFLQSSLLTCLLACGGNVWGAISTTEISSLRAGGLWLQGCISECWQESSHLVFEPCWAFSLKHIVEETLDLPGSCFAIWPSILICSSGRSPAVLNRLIPSSAPATAAWTVTFQKIWVNKERMKNKNCQGKKIYMEAVSWNLPLGQNPLHFTLGRTLKLLSRYLALFWHIKNWQLWHEKCPLEMRSRHLVWGKKILVSAIALPASWHSSGPPECCSMESPSLQDLWLQPISLWWGCSQRWNSSWLGGLPSSACGHTQTSSRALCSLALSAGCRAPQSWTWALSPQGHPLGTSLLWGPGT